MNDHHVMVLSDMMVLSDVMALTDWSLQVLSLQSVTH